MRGPGEEVLPRPHEEPRPLQGQLLLHRSNPLHGAAVMATARGQQQSRLTEEPGRGHTPTRSPSVSDSRATGPQGLLTWKPAAMAHGQDTRTHPHRPRSRAGGSALPARLTQDPSAPHIEWPRRGQRSTWPQVPETQAENPDNFPRIQGGPGLGTSILQDLRGLEGKLPAEPLLRLLLSPWAPTSFSPCCVDFLASPTT